jgi:hypothetical protein
MTNPATTTSCTTSTPSTTRIGQPPDAADGAADDGCAAPMAKAPPGA